MAALKAIVLGAGYRGRAYSDYAAAHPDQLEIVGVADPLQADTIPAPRKWTDWRDCLAERPEADIVMITMPDAIVSAKLNTTSTTKRNSSTRGCQRMHSSSISPRSFPASGRYIRFAREIRVPSLFLR